MLCLKQIQLEDFLKLLGYRFLKISPLNSNQKPTFIFILFYFYLFYLFFILFIVFWGFFWICILFYFFFHLFLLVGG